MRTFCKSFLITTEDMVINQHPFYLKKDIQLQVESCWCPVQSCSQMEGFQIRFSHVWNQKKRPGSLKLQVSLLWCFSRTSRSSGGRRPPGGFLLVVPSLALADLKWTDSYPLNANLHIQLLAPNSVFKLEVFLISLLYVPKPVSCEVHWNL